MNYQRIYDNLINKGLTRSIDGEYCEVHHIIPVCLGGSNSKSNLVVLYPEEHYLAHQLLVKIHPDNISLLYAANAMCVSTKFAKRTSNKLFGWLRRNMAEKQRALMNTPEMKLVMSDRMKLLHANKPDIATQASVRMTERFQTPGYKQEVSDRMKKDNPMRKPGVAASVAAKRKANGTNRRRPLTGSEKKANSERMKDKNPCAQLQPWRHPRSNQESISIWLKAEEYYKWWFINQKGYYAMAQAFGYTKNKWSGAHVTMHNKFKSGWNPTQDKDWLDFSK